MQGLSEGCLSSKTATQYPQTISTLKCWIKQYIWSCPSNISKWETLNMETANGVYKKEATAITNALEYVVYLRHNLKKLWNFHLPQHKLQLIFFVSVGCSWQDAAHQILLSAIVIRQDSSTWSFLRFPTNPSAHHVQIKFMHPSYGSASSDKFCSTEHGASACD